MAYVLGSYTLMVWEGWKSNIDFMVTGWLWFYVYIIILFLDTDKDAYLRKS